MSERRNDQGQDHHEASPEEIESRIRSTQEHLRSDLHALEDRVSPENLRKEAQARVDDTTEMVKEKALETTRQAGEAVRHRIDGWTEEFRRGERMSTLSMIGLAAVIGIGLMLTREPRHRDRYRPRAHAGSARPMDDVGPYGRYRDQGDLDDRGRTATYPQRY